MGDRESAVLPSLNTTSKYQYDNNIMSLEWWQKNIIYHIYLPSFKDSNNDGIGDFQGLISKLDYLDELNIKTLLLSPFYPSPKKDNGYDVSSYVEIDPVYGTMDDFNLFMETVKKKDLNIIVDLIANHTSDQHEWFQRSIRKEKPYSDYYIWVDKRPISTEKNSQVPNNWLSVFGGPAWTWNEKRKQFYFHQFLPEQPDLNFRNPAVTEEIKKVMAFWLDKGVDGFRVDAASHLFEDERLIDEPVVKHSTAKKSEYAYLDHIYTKGLEENYSLLKEFRSVLNDFENKTGKSKIMIVEAVEKIKDVMKYYGTVVDKIAEFPLNFQLYKVKATSTGIDMYEIIDSWLSNMPKGKYPNWVLSSHDDSRVISRVGKDLSVVLQMIIMLLPGIPMWYYGDELGMENTHLEDIDIRDSFALRTTTKNSRDPMRTPMQWNDRKNAGFTDMVKPWLPINKNYKTINVEVEKSDYSSLLNLFKYILQFRDEPTVLVGILEFPLVNETIFSFLRFLVNAKCFLLVFNMSLKPICVNLSKCSKLLPNEAFLEVCSAHFHFPESDDVTDVKNYVLKCKCKDKKFVTIDKASRGNDVGNDVRDIKISLKNIHLKPKEAIVLSFTGKQI